MNHGNLSEVREKMSQSLRTIKEIVDLTLPYLKSTQRKEVIGMWEDFLGELIRHIKIKGRENKCNLFANISFHRVWNK
ncbi:MAG: hypothetical protein GX325_01155 [Peptococcaceae bacterium]|nr:hypothetical protein [Peptococcaceae bacterium]